MSRFDEAFAKVQVLVEQFAASEADYLLASYQESQVRTDYIDKFWIALGWDVRHKYQTNPREQEVKVEQNPDANATGRKADYAFYYKPDYRNPVFFVEAKKPSVKLHGPKGYHQILKYGKNAGTPIGVLMDFEEFHVVDCRYLLTEAECYPLAKIKSFHYKEFADPEKFADIYWIFSHEALEEGKHKAFTSTLPKLRGKGKVKIQAEAEKPIDESFLATLEAYRLTLAKAFKKADESLTAEELTEATQKVIDRLVFIRFLEDKNIEADYIVDQIAAKRATPQPPPHHGGVAMTMAVIASDRRERGNLKTLGDAESLEIASSSLAPSSQETPRNDTKRSTNTSGNSAWKSFINWSKELDVKYNGIVFKQNAIDLPSFKAPDDVVFAKLCEDISHSQSPFLFSYIPIDILGSIYERFLGKVVTATAKRADIEEKPEVRKAGGVYYTPKYIVEYIVANTVGKILHVNLGDKSLFLSERYTFICTYSPLYSLKIRRM